MRKKKLLTAVVSLALVILVALPGTLAVSNGQDSSDTPAETTAPVAEAEKTCTCDPALAEGEAHAEGCPLYVAPAAPEAEKVCTCDPAPAEGQAHAEGCPLYQAPAAPADPDAETKTQDDDKPAEPEAEPKAEDGDKSAEPEGEPKPEDGDKSAEPETPADPVDPACQHIETCSDTCEDETCKCPCHLYKKIMACATLDEIWEIIDAASEEELNALTEEQQKAIEAKIEALEPEPLPAVVINNTVEATVQSEIVTPSRNVTNVAPFLAPVEGAHK